MAFEMCARAKEGMFFFYLLFGFDTVHLVFIDQSNLIVMPTCTKKKQKKQRQHDMNVVEFCERGLLVYNHFSVSSTIPENNVIVIFEKLSDQIAQMTRFRVVQHPNAK